MFYIPYQSIKYSKGFCQAIAIDFQYQKCIPLPNSFVDFVFLCKTQPINIIKEKYIDSLEIVDSYLDYAIENTLVFESNSELDKLIFTNVESSKFDYPSVISNVIIDINILNIEREQEISKQLKSFSLINLEIRFFSLVSVKVIQRIIEIYSNENIKTIRLIIDSNAFENEKEISDLYYFDTKINKMYLYPLGQFEQEKIEKGCVISFIKKESISVTDCGTISSYFFSSTPLHFSESQCHNTCLNRKISIDANNNIKNCPSMEQFYGNIKDRELIDIVRKQEFRKWWYYKKDEIDVCQDCEFRHICTDCRAYIKDPNNIYSQPAKCGYNPYIALWEGQEGWVNIKQWRNENPSWEQQAKENRESYSKENCKENLKEELQYFNNL